MSMTEGMTYEKASREVVAEAIRNILRDNKFRWHGKKGVWYGKGERADIVKALQDAYGVQDAVKDTVSQTINNTDGGITNGTERTEQKSTETQIKTMREAIRKHRHLIETDEEYRKESEQIRKLIEKYVTLWEDDTEK